MHSVRGFGECRIFLRSSASHKNANGASVTFPVCRTVNRNCYADATCNNIATACNIATPQKCGFSEPPTSPCQPSLWRAPISGRLICTVSATLTKLSAGALWQNLSKFSSYLWSTLREMFVSRKHWRMKNKKSKPRHFLNINYYLI